MNRIFARGGRSAMLGAMSKSTDAAARWREIVRAQAESGLSVAAYCRRTRVPQSSFYAWRRKLRDTTTFAEVRVVAPSGAPRGAGHVSASDGAFEVRLPNGRGVLVHPGFDRQTLLDLVATLEAGA